MKQPYKEQWAWSQGTQVMATAFLPISQATLSHLLCTCLMEGKSLSSPGLTLWSERWRTKDCSLSGSINLPQRRGCKSMVLLPLLIYLHKLHIERDWRRKPRKAAACVKDCGWTSTYAWTTVKQSPRLSSKPALCSGLLWVCGDF